MDNFIIIYNSLLDNGNYKLNPEELFLYGLLAARYSNYLGYTETAITLLAQDKILSSDTNSSRRANLVKELLLCLKQKGVIELDNDSQIKSNTLLKIKFPVIGDGHEQVSYEILNMSSSAAEFFVLITLKRFSGFEKAKDKWSDLLGFSSKNTGNSTVTKMVTDGKIFCIEGEKYNDNGFKQHATKWYIKGNQHLPVEGKQITAAVGENEKHTAHKESKEVTIKQESNVKLTSSDNANLDSKIEWGNWNNFNPRAPFINDNDIELYVKQIKNQEFKNIADKKLNSIPEKASFVNMKKIEKRLGMKQQEENKNSIILKGEAVAVDVDSIENYRQYLIDNFGIDYNDGVEVVVFNRSAREKYQRVQLKRMAVGLANELLLNDEVITDTVEAYIDIVKKDKNLDVIIFADIRKKIQNKFNIV